MKSVLITGGSGYFARAFVWHLLKHSDVERICIYSRGEWAQEKMRSQIQRLAGSDSERMRWFIGDVRDEARLVRAMQGIECVVHAAALKRIEVGHYNPEEMVKTNVLGSMNVVEAAREAGVAYSLLISSDKAVEPVSPYGYSKAMAESLFLSANATSGDSRFGVVRYGNVMGSTGSVVPRWRAAAERDEPAFGTVPYATRFWMSVGKAIALVEQACEWQSPVLLPSMDLAAFTLRDLAEAIGVHVHWRGEMPTWEKEHEKIDASRSSADARRMTVPEIKEALLDVE